MLRDILTPADCARCRKCCTFEKYEVWETPLIPQELKEKIEQRFPSVHFIKKGETGAYIFNMSEEWDDAAECFFCPALDPKKGCILGELKPFDCDTWPYRIMDMQGQLVIGLSSLCPELYAKPLEELVKELENGLADKIYSYAEKYPQVVRPYEHGHIILNVKVMKSEDNQTLI